MVHRDFSSHSKLQNFNDYKVELVAKFDQFIKEWEAHGVKLNAAYELIVDRMLIIAWMKECNKRRAVVSIS